MNYVKFDFPEGTTKDAQAVITDTLTGAANLEKLIEAWVVKGKNSLAVEYCMEDNTERSDAEHFAIAFKDSSGEFLGIAFCNRAEALLPYGQIESFDRFFSTNEDEESEDAFSVDEETLDAWWESLKCEYNDVFMGRIGPRSALMPVVASVARSLGGTVMLSPGETNFMASDEQYSQDLEEAGLNLADYLEVGLAYTDPSGDIGPSQLVFDDVMVAIK